MVSFIEQVNNLNLDNDASIILIGGDDSYLVECLLEKGFKNITILDEYDCDQDKKKTELGDLFSEVNWVLSKVSDYIPDRQFDLWCDCSTFFLLNEKEAIDKYIDTTIKAVSGFIILSVFSEFGCKKFNGLVVRQYGEYDLPLLFKPNFIKIKSIRVDEATSYNIIQNFQVYVLRSNNEQLYS